MSDRPAVALLVLALAVQSASVATGQTDQVERLLLESLDAERFGAHLLHLTEEPHPTGSARNMELADYVRNQFISFGLENVHFHDTPALVSYGRSAAVEIVLPDAMALDLTEDSHPEDKDSFLYDDPAVVPYHEYAASGEVTAQVVYANGGSPEDFALLDRMGIEVRGKVVLMRYSVPYSYRGYKVWMAESRGAVGAIIYSDPAEDGYRKGPVYPQGPWGPASHIQWGSIVYDWFGFGVEPFTFHWRQREDGSWEEGPERSRMLPRIPSIPMSHRSAAEILSRLRGPAAPADWQGALPLTYRVGPGPVSVRLQVENEERVVTMRNVIGMIEGTDEPEKWVILGNHRDAWIYGAVDPSGGTAALLETARALGEAARAGHRPRRSIVFANWDAEEDLLGGSTSWVQDHRKKLIEDGVVYINVDGGAVGAEFSGGASPALAAFLRETTRSAPHLAAEGTVFDEWSRRTEADEPEVEIIVGATDYTAFQENVGMSCIDLAFAGDYGVYHSQYDNYFWMSRIADPGFRNNTTMAGLTALLAWRLANVEILPLRFSDYARAAQSHIGEIEAKAAELGGALSLARARSAAVAWQQAAERLEQALAQRASGGAPVAAARALAINESLMGVERALTEERGLESRPFYKHLLYAPQPTYRKEVLPRIFEAIETGSWEAVGPFEQELVAAFGRSVELLSEALRTLEGAR